MSNKKLNYHASAQYFPRLACALHVSLFMQLHERPQAAPVLAWQGIKNAFSCMQNHALHACTRYLTPASQEKGCFRGEIVRWEWAYCIFPASAFFAAASDIDCKITFAVLVLL
ncbi:hypothetical protein [Serratia marcescens]|uniref:hypothetical protein n=1 Tax=Serratia marcescens TaxID=615 RepID=UPI001921FA6F|nr:hypothetical protein [Serratia marcescens]HED2348521.1 hypothetical protein [Serratia marcescens]